jgi:hypothetical protein
MEYLTNFHMFNDIYIIPTHVFATLFVTKIKVIPCGNHSRCNYGRAPTNLIIVDVIIYVHVV